MYKLLCPTDFSKHSVFAIKKALELANLLEAEVHLLTTFTEKRVGSSFKSISDHIRTNRLNELRNLKENLLEKQSFSKEIQIHAINAYPVDGILSFAKSMEMDLIVMGTQGDRSVQNRIFGSVAKSVIHQTTIPVLAIPHEEDLPFFKNNILFAVDNRAIYSNSGFNILNAISEEMDEKIDLVHVIQSDKPAEASFDPDINTHLSGHIGEVHLLEGQDIIKTIEQYIAEHPIGMLVMIRRDHSFLYDFFVQSHTDQELMSANIPIMILPDV